MLGVDETACRQLAHDMRQALANDGRFDIQTLHPYQRLTHTGWDAVLLLGLTQASDVEFAKDQEIRAHMVSKFLTLHVIYGESAERVKNALHSLARQLPIDTALLRPEPEVRWSGPCEVCSDGDCEHRLFSDLLQRSTTRRL